MKSNNAIQNYELLAKLFASENIGVVLNQSLTTAAFDIKNRTLYLPFWDFKQEQLYHFVIGHEVGHALFTPYDDIFVSEEGKELKPIFNIVEDYRIDIKIKQKYPGLVSDYKNGIKWLLENDFFGDEEKISQSLNKINYKTFLDRLVLYLKVKANYESYGRIVFNTEELSLVKKCITCYNFESVITVSREILEYLKREKEKDQENKEDQENESQMQKVEVSGTETSDGGQNEQNETQQQSEQIQPQKPTKNDSGEFFSEIQNTFEQKMNESLQEALSKNITCIEISNCDIISNSKLFTADVLHRILSYYEG